MACITLICILKMTGAECNVTCVKKSIENSFKINFTLTVGRMLSVIGSESKQMEIMNKWCITFDKDCTLDMSGKISIICAKAYYGLHQT